MSNAQKNFRALMNELETLQKAPSLTAEESKSFNEKLEAAKALKAQIESEQALDALKEWGKQPDGNSAVKTGWSGEAIGGEGNIEGVTEEVQSDGRMTGELYDTSPIGKATLKALRSGEYKDAVRDYIRSALPGRVMKQATMKTLAAMKVMQEGIDPSGGLWIPPDLRPQVISKMAGVTGVANDVYSFTTGSDIVSFPSLVYTTDNIWTSGIRPSWTAEAPSAAISEATNPVAGRINIPVHTATCALILTRAMIEDNQFDLLGFISSKIGEAFGLFRDNAYINGDGVGKPQGILSHANATTAHSFTATPNSGMYVPSGISGAVSWLGTTVGTPEPNEGFVGVEQALPPQYEQNAKWYGHKSVWAQTRGLVDTTGRPVWLPENQFSNLMYKVPPSLAGYAVVRDQFVPVPAASSYSVIFGDLGGYYAPQRVGISLEVLRELRALQDEVVVYARARFGGQLVEDWRVKLMKLATS